MNDAVGEVPSIGVIGAGAMGGAVIAGLLSAGWPPAALRVVVRREERAAELREQHGITATDQAAAAASDVLVLATKPAQLLPLLEELSPLVGATTVVASLAAGVTIAAMQRRLSGPVAVVRVMPNTPALVGAGMSVVSGGPGAGEEQLLLVERVMGAVGSTMRVPEALADAASAVSGSGPAYVFYVVDAMAEAGVLLGLSRSVARELAVQTLLGSATLLLESGRHPVELREQVTSPGGTTVEALRVLDERGVRAAFLAAMSAARDRSAQIGAAV